ncbi:MAG: hypothetical protein RR685_09625, partial [Hungatella sp.]
MVKIKYRMISLVLIVLLFQTPMEVYARGEMLTGWQWIDGNCYYLAEVPTAEYPLGAMYAN